jgi:hypothetical protein
MIIQQAWMDSINVLLDIRSTGVVVLGINASKRMAGI